jgi:hypothetical protein
MEERARMEKRLGRMVASMDDVIAFIQEHRLSSHSNFTTFVTTKLEEVVSAQERHKLLCLRRWLGEKQKKQANNIITIANRGEVLKMKNVAVKGCAYFYTGPGSVPVPTGSCNGGCSYVAAWKTLCTLNDMTKVIVWIGNFFADRLPFNRALGARPRGLLLEGVEGCGKSFIQVGRPTRPQHGSSLKKRHHHKKFLFEQWPSRQSLPAQDLVEHPYPDREKFPLKSGKFCWDGYNGQRLVVSRDLRLTTQEVEPMLLAAEGKDFEAEDKGESPNIWTGGPICFCSTNGLEEGQTWQKKSVRALRDRYVCVELQQIPKSKRRDFEICICCRVKLVQWCIQQAAASESKQSASEGGSSGVL